MRIARVDRSIAHVVDPSTGARRIVAHRGFNRAVLDWLEIVSDSESIRPALAGEQSIWIPDVARSSILADTPALDALLDAGVRALVCVPVKSSETPLIAILSVHGRLVTNWTAGQKDELEQLGRSLAPWCLEAQRLHWHLASAAAV
jgi:GAF domain-containing protein